MTAHIAPSVTLRAVVQITFMQTPSADQLLIAADRLDELAGTQCDAAAAESRCAARAMRDLAPYFAPPSELAR